MPGKKHGIVKGKCKAGNRSKDHRQTSLSRYKGSLHVPPSIQTSAFSSLLLLGIWKVHTYHMWNIVPGHSRPSHGSLQETPSPSQRRDLSGSGGSQQNLEGQIWNIIPQHSQTCDMHSTHAGQVTLRKRVSIQVQWCCRVIRQGLRSEEHECEASLSL